MPRYVVLYNWTEQGARAAKDTVRQADAFMVQARDQGITVRNILWLMGPYDAMTVIDAPDDYAVTRLAISAAASGLVRTVTMRAFTAEEIREVVDGLP
ncbi:MAG: GYD domain-containing protein [Armatimonadetes bacterium]|nr:GYD domain-containing protein [Armatimonadota bacterium]